MKLNQITQEKGVIKRVPYGEVPLIELGLEDNQYIVGVDLRHRWWNSDDRKTVDWDWSLFVVTRL